MVAAEDLAEGFSLPLEEEEANTTEATPLAESLDKQPSVDRKRKRSTSKEKPRKMNVDWDVRYRQLIEYQRIKGNCNVPQSEGPLGRWVSSQRKQMKSGQLHDARREALESIGFVWERIGGEDPLSGAWGDRFQQLTEYKRLRGDCNVHQKKEGPLGQWVMNQRKHMKSGKLLPKREEALNSIGFVWEPQKDKWEQNFTELVKFKVENDHCRIPANYEENPELGKWVTTQRSQYKKFIRNQKAWMTQERIDRLNGIGFPWDPQQENWDKKFAELVQFKESRGDCLVPCKAKGLGRWVAQQRYEYRQRLNKEPSQMTHERQEKLDNIGFGWDHIHNVSPQDLLDNMVAEAMVAHGVIPPTRDNDIDDVQAEDPMGAEMAIGHPDILCDHVEEPEKAAETIKRAAALTGAEETHKTTSETTATATTETTENCPICFLPIQNPAGLSHCTHTFCSFCIQRWAAHFNSCPVCKTLFTQVEEYVEVAPESTLGSDIKHNHVNNGMLFNNDETTSKYNRERLAKRNSKNKRPRIALDWAIKHASNKRRCFELR